MIQLATPVGDAYRDVAKSGSSAASPPPAAKRLES